jgi:lysophospholipase L1-like esterase
VTSSSRWVPSRRDLLHGASGIAVAAWWGSPAYGLGSPGDEVLHRSVVDQGETSRLKRVFAKAKRGEPITLGFIGGSITQGAMASQPSRNFASRVQDWWRGRFPNTAVSLVNAGVGGTGSLFGAFRVEQNLLVHDPDLVIVEFAVNDAWTDGEPFEGLLRQILGHPTNPAAMLLFMMWEKGGNSQDMQMPVGKHYGLPMISFRDAVWPEIQAGRLTWSQLIVDTAHPNDQGHLWAANLCTNFFEQVLQQTAPSGKAADSNPLPPPLYSSLYADVRWAPANQLAPTVSNGWRSSYSEARAAAIWAITKERASLRIDWTGTGLAMVLTDRSVPLLSHSTLTIDGQTIRPMDQPHFFDRETIVLITRASRGHHVLQLDTADFPAQQLGRMGLQGLGLFEG